ncbi:hypothetical protein [Evansella cellulosilytica]|uniref:Uncharacterized protein n=1 Tax=Evansella cellulosilytica (strain ATCC 21833 / DSM 2522 / FERM P-1141 / JCM 9156 / N-4) TaxID=649639 RepID=E6U0X2_EVAC2|nr:hypothetical protein [Evansella cellulosilytica]ADU30284.1 hypothetical protein Bcell_2022 [Evansella cellulosilytica DSM 2522]
MQIYFSPELMKEDAQVLNILTDHNKPVGYMAFLLEAEKKKMYIYGHLQDEGVKADFKDLVTPYIQGLTKIKPELEVLTYLSVGGEKVEVEIEKDE